MSEQGWRKSSYTSVNGNCVEVARTLTRVRDSKDPNGPILTVNLTGLLAAIKSGDLDLH